MASFKADSRDDERSKRRSGNPRRRRLGQPSLESLESRRLLATTPMGPPAWHATNSNLADAQNGPMANLGGVLIKVYQDYIQYQKSGAQGPFTTIASKQVMISGNMVGVEVKGYGDFNTYTQALTKLGMHITATLPTMKMAEGWVPIDLLPSIAQQAQTVDGVALFRPTLSVGSASNQADSAMFASTARAQFGVTGAGQQVGVISDSFGQTLGGYADSMKTGDLPAGVKVIQDSNLMIDPNPTDEGRGMLELVHDIAPGAGLAFATGFVGDIGFANNIKALASAGSTVIVDDLSYALDPYFQEGIIQSQGIDQVVGQGVTYLSSAGNHSDSGYQSSFRGVDATVTGIGAGRFQNFDGTGKTVATSIGIQVYNAPASIEMQFDQPWYTNNGVQSEVRIFALDATGAVVAQAFAANNNVANQQPFQLISIPNPGTYRIVVQVVSGPDPGHIAFYERGDGGFEVQRAFGSAGNTYYPTTYGHNSGPTTIGVGAVPWYGAPPYTNPATVTSEPYSSTGPILYLFAPDGSPIPAVLLQKPDISGIDGGETSFFPEGPGNHIDTSQPFEVVTPYPGEPTTVPPSPTTPTNINTGALPNFFGTSAAAPNVAAVVALMRQANPSITRSEILTDLETTARPLNGSTKGVWDRQGGFGLVNASAAVAAAATLRVLFISPGASQTLAAAPSFVTVQFNKAVDIKSISSNTLKVTGPNGATVLVGQPFGVDNPNFPTLVRFPITIIPRPGTVANGTYTTQILAGSVIGQTGQVLQTGVGDQFSLQQLNGPQILTTAFVGRIVTIKFTQAVNPATVNSTNLYLFRSNGASKPLFNPTGIIVSQLPGAVLTYDPATLTATIDLNGVPQSSLPSDQYGLVATTGITDLVGNSLNGQFNGVFPSGKFPALGGSTFVQNLGLVQLQPPLISALVLAPATDSGIQGDNNTNIRTPSFVGQIAARFPGSLAGLVVYAEFNGLPHPGVAAGGLDLGVGANGRGFVGHFDVQTITDSLGRFTINFPPGLIGLDGNVGLPEGQNRIRVLAVGQPDLPPFPGYSSSRDAAFRIDESLPYVGTVDGSLPTSFTPFATINALPSLRISVVDPVNPTKLGDPFAVDPKLAIPALNPVLAENTQNYRLLLINTDGSVSDKSSFINTATFKSTSARTLSSDPFTGNVNLTFAPGLPTGVYHFIMLSSAFGTGLADAAGNPFGGYQATASQGIASNYELDFTLQPTPTYITNYSAFTPDPTVPGGFTATGPRANYELPVSGITPRAPAPPTGFSIDFSNTLASMGTVAQTNAYYTRALQLVRSANNTTGSIPDGEFGDLGITNTSGYTQVTGFNVSLVNSVPGATPGQYGYNNRLVIYLPPGLTLPADYYRFYLPNTGQQAITDIYGSQLDGEFKGYQDATGKYVNLLPNGQVRGSGLSEVPDLTGDGTPGGAFMTGFVVVPNGNIIYARADAPYDPSIPSQNPDGSLARPYPVLAPEAAPNNVNGGDLNSVVNAKGNFNLMYDRSGDKKFEPSAFYAAQQRIRVTQGPAVIIAVQSIPSRDLDTGAIVQKPFVLQAPMGSDPVANDASAAVPALTTLIFEVGTTVKMLNSSLFIQNQGSALQVLGGPNSYQNVNITSYKDSSIGGVTSGDPNMTPNPGDYGGLVFRNFSQAALPGGSTRTSLFPGQIPNTGVASADQRLKGQFTDRNNPGSQLDAVSGADDVMSYISFLIEKYAGGAVPQTSGIRYDGITLKNSRPTVVNSTIAFAGGVGSAQAGLSADVDSLRSDDVAQGPLLRNDVFLNNGLNGIYIRAELNGIAESTNAILYPNNSPLNGGAHNYVLDNPYPYLLTSRLVIGSLLQQESGGIQTTGTSDRLYIDTGMILKFERGAALQVASGNASLNVGDRTYITQFDKDPTVGPTFAALLANGQVNPMAGQKNPNYKPNSAGLAHVIFTSLYDDVATTSFFDPISQTRTTIVQPLAAVTGGSGVLQPTSGNVPLAARWGGISLVSGSVDVINSADFRYGGGQFNTAGGTGAQHVLEVFGSNLGAHISVTNNLFTDNLDVPINLSPNALLAADPQRPLASGNPFIHGNLFLNNGIDGVGVQGGTDTRNPNLLVNSVWAGSDFTYVLRDTIVLGPNGGFGGFGNGAGVLPLPTNAVSTLLPEPKPNVLLTLQSTLPGTILADGTVVAAPGVPLVVKLLNNSAPFNRPTDGTNTPVNTRADDQGGAGFIVGVDNGDDTTPGERLVNNGAFSQIRIVGIGANQTTGQTRVPVIITSLYDNSVGTTVNNVVMNKAVPGTTPDPKAGDGGIIYFGGNSLTNYTLQDPRSGSLIDNADIRYITRIEQQGGGIIYTYDTNNSGGFAFLGGVGYDTKLGLDLGGNVGFGAQYNQAKGLTLSNSNFSTFSDVGFVAHPGYDAIGVEVNYIIQNSPFLYRVPAFLGEATHTYFVNNTFSNMPGIAAEIISENVADNVTQPSPAMAVFLNNTFYNVGTAIHTYAPAATGINFNAHVAFLAMDNIFSNTGTMSTFNFAGNAVQADGQAYGSDLQYNLFFKIGGTNSVGVPNNQPIFGDPAFRDAANGNFVLLPNSAAIDVARSELGPSIFGDMLYPSYTINPLMLNMIPVRNNIGDVNPFGGGPAGFVPSDADIVTLPGEPVQERGFPDQWIPVLASAGTGTAGTGTNVATFKYAPFQGERDQAGTLRIKSPTSKNVGFGSRPFFDLGAFEYIVQNPPVVTGVVAVANGNSSNLYSITAVAGVNQAPQTIQVRFNERIDPTTINAMSVILLASGGDGIFGNGNSPADRAINLAGLLSFDNATNSLVINTAGIFSNAALLNDEYRLILKGTGSAVIRDTTGVALDGYTNNDTLPLPSGSDNFPGSDFLVTFTISTQSPKVLPGTFRLDPASDTSGGRSITKINLPTFIGSITDTFPPINPLVGQNVAIDVSSRGDGNFDLINAGVGTTDAQGNFRITLTTPIPDTPNPVGFDGIRGDLGATYTEVRVRVTNQAGNSSFSPTDPFSTYLANNAGAFLQVDTKLPQITAFSPLANTVATVNANGQVIVTVTFNENIKTSSLNANSIQVFRSGGTGVFTGAPIAVPIVTNSFMTQYLGDATGSETVTFALQGPLPNDVYEVILKGTGATPVTDIAGNPLSGAFNGTFPTGGSNAGSDFSNLPVTVFQASQAHLIYVQAPTVGTTGVGTQGTFGNPFPTIGAAMAKALIGDDVLVLPGAYRENVVLKAGVRLLSASLASSDTQFMPGSPGNTLIYGVSSLATAPGFNFGSTGNIITVSTKGAVFGVPTEIRGFSIISPLIGDSTLGTIDSTDTAIQALNSDVLIDRNNIINAGIGISLGTTGASAPTATVQENVIAGNLNGIGITDNGATSSLLSPFMIVNNTISDNTVGLYNVSSTPNSLQAYVLNNIFYSNHDLTSTRNGTGIASNQPNTLGVGFNLFYSNGANPKNPGSNALGVFGGFVPSALSAVPDSLGNFIGDPAFVQARDPRPNGDTPSVFFLDGNYDLMARSAAINAANSSVAPATDFLYRNPVKIAGKGFANTGPASIGAYYYRGTGGPTFSPGIPFTGGTTGTGTGTGTGGGGGGGSNGTQDPTGTVAANSRISTAAILPNNNLPGGPSTVGGGQAIGTRQFNVVTTSLSNNGTAHASDVAGVLASEAAPSFIDIDFSDSINPGTVSPDELVLSGSGINPASPAKASSLAWVDDHTIRFYLSGGFNPSGTVNVSIARGAMKDLEGASLVGFNDSFQIAPVVTPVPSPITLATLAVQSPAALAVAQPTAVAGPVTVPGPIRPAKHAASKTNHVAPSTNNHAKHATIKATHSKAAHPKAAPTVNHRSKHGK